MILDRKCRKMAKKWHFFGRHLDFEFNFLCHFWWNGVFCDSKNRFNIYWNQDHTEITLIHARFHLALFSKWPLTFFQFLAFSSFWDQITFYLIFFVKLIILWGVLIQVFHIIVIIRYELAISFLKSRFSRWPPFFKIFFS